MSACRANIKVSSTETGAIFGNIVYEDTGSSGRSVVVLNDVHIDIMDYISPANCPDIQFRSMWAEFEWENKVCCSSQHLAISSTLLNNLQWLVANRLIKVVFVMHYSLHAHVVHVKLAN